MEEITKAKTFPGFIAQTLNMVDELKMSADYINELESADYNVWICSKRTQSKSILNSFLIENLSTGIDLFERFYNKSLLNKKKYNIKLI